MTFVKTLSNSLLRVWRKTNVYDIDVIRQNAPPDERDVDAIEQAAACEVTRDVPGKLSRLNILAPVILGMLEILPSIECDVFLSSF
jgi:hypothetical protein